MTDNEQLIAQARDLHAKAMNCSDMAHEGAWVARETVSGLPMNNYWAVTATRTPTAKGVEPFTVWKAHVNTPAMAGLLTFVSTGLPQLCDLAERAQALEAENGRMREALTKVRPVLESLDDVGEDTEANIREAMEAVWSVIGDSDSALGGETGT